MTDMETLLRQAVQAVKDRGYNTQAAHTGGGVLTGLVYPLRGEPITGLKDAMGFRLVCFGVEVPSDEEFLVWYENDFGECNAGDVTEDVFTVRGVAEVVATVDRIFDEHGLGK